MSFIDDTIITLALNITLVNGGSGSSLDENLTTDLQSLTPGVVYYSIAWTYTGLDTRTDLNLSLHGYELEIWIRFHLTGTSEFDYMSGTGNNKAEPLMRALGDPHFYLYNIFLNGPNPDIYGFQEDEPLKTIRPTREGNIISFGAEVRLLLNY